ncbi:MAG: FAD-dependent oxidoreductase [Pseudomonadota bacterium]
MRVAVVGAGIAGLAAATWARDLGHEVVVFEATDRPGGRARTLARPGATDIVDIGTQYFHGNYRRGLALVRRAGLASTLRPVRGSTRFFDDRARGGSFTTGHRLPWIRAVSPAGNLRLIASGAWQALGTRLDAYALANRPDLDAIAALDRITDPAEREFTARTLVSVGTLAEPGPDSPSYLQLLRLMKIVLLTAYLTLDRGIASLHEALAAALPVHYDTPVARLAPGRLELEAGGSVEADHVICAVAAPAAARLLPDTMVEERRFLATIAQPPGVIVTLFLDGPLERGVWSYVFRPDRNRLVSFCSDGAQKNPAMVPSGRAALQAWIVHPASRRAAALDDAALTEAVIAELAPAFPRLADRVEHADVARIAATVPQFPPGHAAAARRFHDAMRARAGIDVVGDFLSGGYAEAALWSAETAVRALGPAGVSRRA